MRILGSFVYNNEIFNFSKSKKGLFMKRSLYSVFFVSILGIIALQADEKSGIFVGGDVGIVANSTEGSITIGSTEVSLSPSYGVRTGYQQYFDSYNGLRAYGNFNYLYLGNVYMMKYGINVDYLLNFSDSDSPWGFFVGAGYEWIGGAAKKILDKEKANSLDGEKIKTNGVLINVGFSKIYNNHHRIEFGVKVPLYAYISIDTPDIKDSIRTFGTLYFAYSYSF